MLRRRRKGPKPEIRGQTQGQTPYSKPSPGAGTRRRARPDVPVPPELKIGKHRGPLPRERGEAVVLVTGFDPFCGEKTNPSWEVCTRLPATIDGLRVETLRVPCEFRRSIEVVAAAIERHRPSIVLCIGQAGGRTQIGIERVAINVNDARVADNAGAQPVDEPIAAEGPAAYFATVPVKAMAISMREAGVPAEVSNTAGTYVCNHLMYGVLHHLAASGTKTRAGFIHVPYSEDQVIDKRAMPAMSIASMVKGIEAAIAAARRHRHDLPVSEGTFD